MEKTWEEIGLEEKVERLRIALLHLSEMANNTCQDVRVLLEHKHLDGQLLVNISRVSQDREFPYFVRGLEKKR